MVKFSELKVGEWFRYQNQEFKKTLPIDMGSVIYNAITKEVFGWSNVVFMRDWQRVHKICPTPLALDGAIAHDNQQVLPADVLAGEGNLPEPPRQ